MRDATFFIPYPDLEEINFAANGAPEQVQGFYGISGIMSPTAPTYLLSYHEILFLKAEAQVRNNNLDEAKATLEDAVEAAFEKVEVGMTLDSTYRVTIQNQFDAAPLKEVMTQKYLAFFESEAVEAYNDIRRLKAMGDNVITLANPLKFPLRYTYGADDVTTNLKVAAAYGTGAYIYTENVWWAGGTR
jgi:hypothetical protein